MKTKYKNFIDLENESGKDWIKVSALTQLEAIKQVFEKWNYKHKVKFIYYNENYMMLENEQKYMLCGIAKLNNNIVAISFSTYQTKFVNIILNTL